jgi:hypothetical protein
MAFRAIIQRELECKSQIQTLAQQKPVVTANLPSTVPLVDALAIPISADNPDGLQLEKALAIISERAVFLFQQ